MLCYAALINGTPWIVSEIISFQCFQQDYKSLWKCKHGNNSQAGDDDFTDAEKRRRIFQSEGLDLKLIRSIIKEGKW